MESVLSDERRISEKSVLGFPVTKSVGTSIVFCSIYKEVPLHLKEDID
jgi:hypothetical protein